MTSDILNYVKYHQTGITHYNVTVTMPLKFFGAYQEENLFMPGGFVRKILILKIARHRLWIIL